MKILIPIFFLFMLSVVPACERIPAEQVSEGDDSYLLPEVGALFRVDSLVIKPAVGGADQIFTSYHWRFNELATDSLRERTFLVEESTDSTSRNFLWNWTAEKGRAINTLNGRTYLSLVTPFIEGLRWDPLYYSTEGLEVTVAGQPIAIHKNWSAQVDSIALYTLPDGSSTPAVWVTLANSENLLELREVKEVYGQDKGLLEQHYRIFDTQNTDDSIPWLERAEQGFTLDLIRVN